MQAAPCAGQGLPGQDALARDLPQHPRLPSRGGLSSFAAALVLRRVRMATLQRTKESSGTRTWGLGLGFRTDMRAGQNRTKIFVIASPVNPFGCRLYCGTNIWGTKMKP